MWRIGGDCVPSWTSAGKAAASSGASAVTPPSTSASLKNGFSTQVCYPSLFVAYFASAEMGCFLALGWPMPTHLLDLYVEFKWLTCGRDGEPSKPSLVYALDWFGLESIDANEKESMRQLAIRGGPYTEGERQALLTYCEADVNALARLL